MADMQGKFVWYELMTTDTTAAADFYTHVIGWTAKDAGMGMPYTLLSAGPTMVAGLMAIPPDVTLPNARPTWVAHIGVADVDQQAERIKAAGGSIFREPQDIPAVGRFAVAADPQGAAFLIFKGNTEPTEQPPLGTPGHVGWHELNAVDLDAAIPFYLDLFGWKLLDAFEMGEMGKYQMFEAAEGALGGGMMNKPPMIPAPFWLYYFVVDGLDAAVSRIEQGGGKLMHGPVQVPGGGWIAHAMDPQGAHFALTAKAR